MSSCSSIPKEGPESWKPGGDGRRTHPLLPAACWMACFSPPEQKLVDEEKKDMAKPRRTKRSTSTFNFGSYHTIDEVLCSVEHSLHLGGDMLRPCLHPCSEVRGGRCPPAHETPPWTEVLVEPGGWEALHEQCELSWHLPTLLEDNFNFILGFKVCV